MKFVRSTAALRVVASSTFARNTHCPGLSRSTDTAATAGATSGISHRPELLQRIARLLLGLLIAASIAQPAVAQQRVRSGSLKLAGYWATCGPIETDVMTMNDIAASTGNRIVLNPDLFAMPRAQQMFWYTHECGHQIFGPNEQVADCWSAEQGRIQGWLTAREFELLATSIGRTPGDATHASGAARVAYLRQCFYK